MIQQLRRDCPGEVFNYTFIMDHLQGYANPRGKIGRMLRSNEIVRVRKGLYVFGEQYRNEPISREVIANLIYGPSYVSGLYALSQHGLIPERVETVTSMTTQRNRLFNTPFGRFEYHYLNAQRYTVGVDWRQVDRQERCLFASPEKALIDIIARERDLLTKKKLMDFLLENLRIDEDSLANLNLVRVAKISAVYASPVVRLLNEVLGGMV